MVALGVLAMLDNRNVVSDCFAPELVCFTNRWQQNGHKVLGFLCNWSHCVECCSAHLHDKHGCRWAVTIENSL